MDYLQHNVFDGCSLLKYHQDQLLPLLTSLLSQSGGSGGNSSGVSSGFNPLGTFQDKSGKWRKGGDILQNFINPLALGGLLGGSLFGGGGDDGFDLNALLEEQRRREEEIRKLSIEHSQMTPEEKASRTRGFGLEEQLALGAENPQRFIDQARPGVEGLTENLTNLALGEVENRFQNRGIQQSGLTIEGGSRAAIEQSIGVSQLVLQRAQQNAAFLRGVTSDITNRGLSAQNRATSGALAGLGLGANIGNQGALMNFQDFQQQGENERSQGGSIGQLGTSLLQNYLGGQGGGTTAPTASSLLTAQNLTGGGQQPLSGLQFRGNSAGNNLLNRALV